MLSEKLYWYLPRKGLITIRSLYYSNVFRNYKHYQNAEEENII